MFPPTIGIFSNTMTDFPFSAAVMAAVRPAPPAPITMTSASYSASRFSAAGFSFETNNVLSAPVFSKAFLIAFLNPEEVRVAPDTVSTSMLLVAIISSDSISKAMSKPSDSSCSSTLMALMALSLISISTIISPPLPIPVP